MAKFIGIAGDFMKEKAFKHRVNALVLFFMAFVLIVYILGCFSGFLLGRFNVWGFLCFIAAICVSIPSFKYIEKNFDKHIRESRKEEKGADGESDFVKHLKDLPDTYTVICDLPFADSYGNIDHLVIGPTGVFSIDVKDWMGTVASDGKGELLLNGRPTDKPQVRYFTRRTMDLKERFKALTKLEPYIQCVFVFPHTYVESKWGTTGAVHCIRAEQIVDYVSKARVKNPIPPADLARLVSAAKSLKENAV